MFNLYDYQEETVQGIRDSFNNGSDATILCIPTGGGKTVVFSHIAKKAIGYENRVMIACDRKELITQSYNKVRNYGLWPTIIAPNNHFVKNECYVASVDTLLRRNLDIDVDLLIIDEAHKAKFDKLVDKYKGKAKIIGATATPIRSGSQRSLDTLYDNIVNPVSVSDLISINKLTPALHYAAKIDTSALSNNKLEYDNREMFDFYDKQTMYEGVLENFNKFCNNEPTIVFNVNREHSRKTTKEFLDAGISAAHVDGSFSKYDREKILNQFYSGKILVLLNCSILTTGYDNPRIRNVITNRATKSLSLWLQMCGRGSRILPKSDNYGNKSEFRIIDMGSNVANLGFWDDDREFTLKSKGASDKKGAPPVKDCPKCEAIIHASKPVCPHCKYLFPIKKKKLVKAEFEQITKEDIPDHLKKPYSKMNYEELEQIRKIKGYKKGWTEVQITLNKGKRRGVKVSRSVNDYK